jgi:hypothetical protein
MRLLTVKKGLQFSNSYSHELKQPCCSSRNVCHNCRCLTSLFMDLFSDTNLVPNLMTLNWLTVSNLSQDLLTLLTSEGASSRAFWDLEIQ